MRVFPFFFGVCAFVIMFVYFSHPTAIFSSVATSVEHVQFMLQGTENKAVIPQPFVPRVFPLSTRNKNGVTIGRFLKLAAEVMWQRAQHSKTSEILGCSSPWWIFKQCLEFKPPYRLSRKDFDKKKSLNCQPFVLLVLQYALSRFWPPLSQVGKA